MYFYNSLNITLITKILSCILNNVKNYESRLKAKNIVCS